MSALVLALLGVPAVAAVGLALARRISERTAVLLGIFGAGVDFLLALAVAFGFDYRHAGRLQAAAGTDWIGWLGVRFAVGVDGLSLALVLLTALLVLLCAVSLAHSVPDPGRPRVLLAWLFTLEFGVLGTFLATDLLLFFVAFEVVLVPMYFLIARWGGELRRRAAIKFLLYTFLGSAVLLVGVLTVGLRAHTFAMPELAAGAGARLPRSVQDFAFATLAVGFAVKAPLWPLHTWLPDAHTEAPTVGSVLLAGVLLKLGTYGLVRVAVGELPAGARDAAPYLGVLAVVSILYGSLCCLAQRDLKRLIAYSSVGHMGFVLLGVASLTQVGIAAAMFGNIAHGVITGLLFFLVGAIKDRYHTADIAALGGGVLAKLPHLGALVVAASIASLGLPGLAGFWGELFALLGAWSPQSGQSVVLFRGLAVAGLVGTLLTAGYFLWMLQRVAFGAVPARWRSVQWRDIAPVELAAWTPLVLLALVLGLYPHLVTGAVNPAVGALLGSR